MKDQWVIIKQNDNGPVIAVYGPFSSFEEASTEKLELGMLVGGPSRPHSAYRQFSIYPLDRRATNG